MNFKTMVCPEVFCDNSSMEVYATHATQEMSAHSVTVTWGGAELSGDTMNNIQFTTAVYKPYNLCVTCPRSGPNWGGLKEPLGQQRDQAMLPVASTMGRITPRCWSLGDGIRITTPSVTCGSWMSSPGGGGR